MNILLLSNNAPNYQYFFGFLSERLISDGHSVSVAVDSEFSKDVNKLYKLGLDHFEFSSYFSKHKTDYVLLKKYAKFNLNSALLSDFERAEVYGIMEGSGVDYFNKLKSALLAFFEEIVIRRNIHIVLYENVSNTFAHFALYVAQENGVAYCGVGGSRLPGRFSISNDPMADNASRKKFIEISSKSIDVMDDVLSWSDEYIRNIEKIEPDYMKINGLDDLKLIKRYLRLDRLKTIFLLLVHARDDSYHSFQIGNPIKHYANLFKRNVARKIKSIWLRNYYDISADEQYLLYPLHFHPESSTSILAGAYLNEYEVIRNMAFNMPEGVFIYIKDHKSAYGFPSLDFYNNLKKLPNVRVIHPNENTKELIRKSLGVVTLTSTVGYEALLMGKRVFLFGTVFYEFHKNVVKIEDPLKFFDLIRSNIYEDVVVSPEYTRQFVAAYYLSTLKGSLNLMLKATDAKIMVDDLYDEIYSYMINVVRGDNSKLV